MYYTGEDFTIAEYDGIKFIYSSDGAVFCLEMDPDFCTFDGAALSGDPDRISSLLGYPYETRYTSRYIVYDSSDSGTIFTYTYPELVGAYTVIVEFPTDSANADRIYMIF